MNPTYSSSDQQLEAAEKPLAGIGPQYRRTDVIQSPLYNGFFFSENIKCMTPIIL